MVDLAQLANAVPPDDTSISPRALAQEFKAAQDRGEQISNVAGFLNRVRALTRRERNQLSVFSETEDERQRSWTSRRTTTDKVLARRAKEIIAVLHDSIATLREQLFDRRTPPFTSLASAAVWMGKHVHVHGQPKTGEPHDIVSFQLALHDQLQRLTEADAWREYGLSVSLLRVRYYQPDGRVTVRALNRELHGSAHSLQRWAERVSEETMLPTASLIAHVLVGLIPGELVRLSDGRNAAMPGIPLVALERRTIGSRYRVGRERIVLDVDFSDLTERTLRLIRQEAHKRFRLKPSHRPATMKQRRIADIVTRLGGPPRTKYDRGFWTRALREINRGVRSARRVEDPIALARRFYRARQRQTA